MDFFCLFCLIPFTVLEELQHFLALKLLIPGDGAVARVGF